MRDGKLTVTSFLYLGSSQSWARTQRIACLRSRALQTSLRPFTRPIKRMECSECVQSRCHQSSCRSGTYPHEDLRRCLPSLAWDFLITLLMASVMLSAFSSSCGTSTCSWFSSSLILILSTNFRNVNPKSLSTIMLSIRAHGVLI